MEHAIAHIEEAAVHNLPENEQRWYAVKIFERDEKAGGYTRKKETTFAA